MSRKFEYVAGDYTPPVIVHRTINDFKLPFAFKQNHQWFSVTKEHQKIFFIKNIFEFRKHWITENRNVAHICSRTKTGNCEWCNKGDRSFLRYIAPIVDSESNLLLFDFGKTLHDSIIHYFDNQTQNRNNTNHACFIVYKSENFNNHYGWSQYINPIPHFLKRVDEQYYINEAKKLSEYIKWKYMI